MPAIDLRSPIVRARILRLCVPVPLMVGLDVLGASVLIRDGMTGAGIVMLGLGLVGTALITMIGWDEWSGM